MNGHVRINISLPPKIQELAAKLMELRHYDNFSVFLSALIREEWERRQSPMTFATPSPTGAPAALQVAEELAARHDSQPSEPPPHESARRSVPYPKPSRASRARSSSQRDSKARKKK